MHLDRVRTEGDFEGWVKYYLTAIEQSCIDAYQRIQEIELLEQKIRSIIASNELFKSSQAIAQQALSIFFEYPVITTQQLSQQMGENYDIADNTIEHYVQVGILVPSGAQQQDKQYIF